MNNILFYLNAYIHRGMCTPVKDITWMYIQICPCVTVLLLKKKMYLKGEKGKEKNWRNIMNTKVIQQRDEYTICWIKSSHLNCS